MEDYRNEFAKVDAASVSPAEYEAMKAAAMKKERTELFTNASLLAILLLLYNVFIVMYKRVYWLAAYTVYSGKVSLDIGQAVDYFDTTAPKVTSSTGFLMTGAVFNVLISGLSIFIIGQFLMKIKLSDLFKPQKGFAADGLKYFPAQLTFNHFASVLMLILSNALMEEGITLPESDFSMDSPTKYEILIEFVYLCIAGPIVEEFIYRGLCIKLLSPFGSGLAIAFSSVSFGLMHGNLKQAVPAMLGGVVYALVAVKYKSILPSILIHILNNIVSSVSDFGSVLGWSNTGTISNAIFIVMLFIGFYGVIVLFVELAERIYNEEPECVMPAGKRFLAVGTNIFCVIYFIYLIKEIVDKIIQAN